MGGHCFFLPGFVKHFFFQNKHNVTGTGTDLGKQYITFVRSNQDQVGKKITDDLWVLSTMEVNYYLFALLFPLILHFHLNNFSEMVSRASWNALHLVD